MAKNYYTTTEIAKLIGITRQGLIKILNRGEIEHIKAGKHNRIPHSELERIYKGKEIRWELLNGGEPFDKTK